MYMVKKKQGRGSISLQLDRKLQVETEHIFPDNYKQLMEKPYPFLQLGVLSSRKHGQLDDCYQGY